MTTCPNVIVRYMKFVFGREIGGKVETSWTHTEREANTAVRELSIPRTIGLQL